MSQTMDTVRYYSGIAERTIVERIKIQSTDNQFVFHILDGGRLFLGEVKRITDAATSETRWNWLDYRTQTTGQELKRIDAIQGIMVAHEQD